jgi:isopenicillin-N N-acyltransferase-like protein
MDTFFPIFRLKGGPFEIGFAHGRSLAREIRYNVSMYMEMASLLCGMNETQVLTFTRKVIGSVRDVAPHLIEEMKGIAEGADTSLESIMVINARTELFSAHERLAECTAIGLTAARTASGSVLLAQNWDWRPESKARSAFFVLEPENGPRALVFCEAGQVGKIGLNEGGLGVLLNILPWGESCAAVPVHVLLRLILGEQTVPQAVSLMKNHSRASASHFLLGDLRGELVGLEFTPDSVVEIRPLQGAVVHTNHFLAAHQGKKAGGLPMAPDTFDRMIRAKRLLSSLDRWSIRDLERALTDHEGSPSSICRHVDNGAPYHMRLETVGSFVLDLEGKKIFASQGQPCGSPYREVSLK